MTVWQVILTAVSFSGWIWMMCDYNASKIRASRAWPLFFILNILLVCIWVPGVIGIMNQTGVTIP